MSALFAGIDAGSSAVKAVVIDRDGNVRGSGFALTGIQFEVAAEQAMEEALKAAGADRQSIERAVSCGYGRRNVPFADGTKTEIACIAKRIHPLFPGPSLVLDIGSRDVKAVQIDSRGAVSDFKLNSRCAAGTGSFLEDMALRLRIPVEKLNDLAESADKAVPIGAHCTVFAAGEVLAAARKGICIENVVLGIFESMVKRTEEMVTTNATTVLTGGVAAHNPVLRPLLAAELKREVHCPPHPQLTGAVGAALFAIEGSHD